MLITVNLFYQNFRHLSTFCQLSSCINIHLFVHVVIVNVEIYFLGSVFTILFAICRLRELVVKDFLDSNFYVRLSFLFFLPVQHKFFFYSSFIASPRLSSFLYFLIKKHLTDSDILKSRKKINKVMIICARLSPAVSAHLSGREIVYI